MATPSPAFLAALNAQMANVPPPAPPPPPPPDPFAAGAAAQGISPVTAKPESTLMGSGSSVPGAAPIVVPGVQPAPAPASPPPTGETYGPPNPNAPAQPAGAPASTEPLPNDVQFTPVQSGGAPAREVPTRGPTQTALMQDAYKFPLAAANNVEGRTVEMAGHEAEMYDSIANDALERQAAFERQAARRAQEMQKLQADYMTTVQQLGEMKINNNRVWENTSTLDKIGATLLAIIGHFGGNGNNIVLQSIMGQINDDVDNQKLAYERGLDVAKGQQTAFGMAMQRFNSEDAAYHAALAAGQQAVAAKVAGMNANWKGVNAQNSADDLRGKLLFSAEQNLAEGFKYLQPTMGSTKYKMSIRGQQIPGLVSEEKAQGYSVEHGVKPAEVTDQALLKGGIEQTLQSQKLTAEQQKAQKLFQVVLPNGETVNAPNEKEADNLREMSLVVSKTERLVNEAKQIREDPSFRVSVEGRNRLKQIQADLVTNFGVQKKLGALSNADMDLAIAGTADLFQFGNGVEARLDRLSREGVAERIARVKTYPSAQSNNPKSTGQMPASFTAHGKK